MSCRQSNIQMDKIGLLHEFISSTMFIKTLCLPSDYGSPWCYKEENLLSADHTLYAFAYVILVNFHNNPMDRITLKVKFGEVFQLSQKT